MTGMSYHSLMCRSLMLVRHTSVLTITQNLCLNTFGWALTPPVTALVSTLNGSDGLMSLHWERPVAITKPFTDALCRHLCLPYSLLPSKTNWYVESKDSSLFWTLLDHLDPTNNVQTDKMHALTKLALKTLFAMTHKQQIMTVVLLLLWTLRRYPIPMCILTKSWQHNQIKCSLSSSTPPTI